MGKRILITSTDLMMVQFLLPHVRFLTQQGFEVEIACSEVGGRMPEIRERLRDDAKKIHVVRLVRSPISPSNLMGYRDLKRIIDGGGYDVIWTNEPVMGVATRLAAKKARRRGTRIVYMAHGFHFFKGASKKAWMVYYPIEKYMLKYCDLLITINEEDFSFAKKKFSRRVRVGHIHGIGVDMDRYHPASSEEQLSMRMAEGLTADDFIILCTGELNENKNQKTLISAVVLLKDKIPHLKVLLAGKGPLEQAIRDQIQTEHLEGIVKLLGYRKDLERVVPAVDLVVSCSFREGLGLNIIEGMLCQRSVIAAENRGHRELLRCTGILVRPDDPRQYAEKIVELFRQTKKRRWLGEQGYLSAQTYSLSNVCDELRTLILGLFPVKNERINT